MFKLCNWTHALWFFFSAGVGRTGVFITLSCVLERMQYEGVVDVFQTGTHLLCHFMQKCIVLSDIEIISFQCGLWGLNAQPWFRQRTNTNSVTGRRSNTSLHLIRFILGLNDRGPSWNLVRRGQTAKKGLAIWNSTFSRHKAHWNSLNCFFQECEDVLSSCIFLPSLYHHTSHSN